MSNITKDQVIEWLSAQTILDLASLVKDLEGKWGVSAAAAAAPAAAGGAAVAGVATAVAGAVFAPAIPFILAGSAAGGALMGGSAKKKETAAREAILAQCMTDRGYKAYTSQ